jgi:hypothetical protein
MKHNVVYILLFLWFSLLASGQDENPIEIFNDAEFYYVEKQYRKALPFYLKLLETDSLNANFNYLAASCYFNIIPERKKAIPYLLRASENIVKWYSEAQFEEKGAPPEVYRMLGVLYQYDEELSLALEYYKKFKDAVRTEDKRKQADYHIRSVMIANELSKQYVPFSAISMGGLINTRHSDYNPVFARNETVLAYTSFWESEDVILITWKENGNWVKPINITEYVGSQGFTYTTAISKDARRLYLVRQDIFNADIYVSEYNGERWMPMEPMNNKINSAFMETSMCLSQNEDTIIFSSNRMGGNGDMDLYLIAKEKTGKWGKAVNLGETINTKYAEEAPFLASNGNILFFSSKGHQSMGGYDIFYSIKDKSGQWTKPINVGYPLNTTSDDLSYVPTGDGNNGYYVRDLPGGYGLVDIYRVEIPSERLFADKLANFDTELMANNIDSFQLDLRKSETFGGDELISLGLEPIEYENQEPIYQENLLAENIATPSEANETTDQMSDDETIISESTSNRSNSDIIESGNNKSTGSNTDLNVGGALHTAVATQTTKATTVVSAAAGGATIVGGTASAIGSLGNDSNKAKGKSQEVPSSEDGDEGLAEFKEQALVNENDITEARKIVLTEERANQDSFNVEEKKDEISADTSAGEVLADSRISSNEENAIPKGNLKDETTTFENNAQLEKQSGDVTYAEENNSTESALSQGSITSEKVESIEANSNNSLKIGETNNAEAYPTWDENLAENNQLNQKDNEAKEVSSSEKILGSEVVTQEVVHEEAAYFTPDETESIEPYQSSETNNNDFEPKETEYNTVIEEFSQENSTVDKNVNLSVSSEEEVTNELKKDDTLSQDDVYSTNETSEIETNEIRAVSTNSDSDTQLNNEVTLNERESYETNDKQFIESDANAPESKSKSLVRYTIQIIALQNAKPTDRFGHVGKVKASKGNDGFTRYTFGEYPTYSQAKKALTYVHDMGFSDSFIRDVSTISNYY